jgi:hypothetical protein
MEAILFWPIHRITILNLIIYFTIQKIFHSMLTIEIEYQVIKLIKIECERSFN